MENKSTIYGCRTVDLLQYLKRNQVSYKRQNSKKIIDRIICPFVFISGLPTTFSSKGRDKKNSLVFTNITPKEEGQNASKFCAFQFFNVS